MRGKFVALSLGLAIAAWLIAPTVASAQENHYACYQVKDLKIPAKLASKQTGTYISQNDAGVYEKCKLKYVCMPTSKDGSPIPDPSLHYLCHQCKGFKGAINYDVSDQFVNGRVQVKKLKFLCNPGSKTPA